MKYVGRVEERAALEEAMKLARAGQRQVVLLSGEPGIGKTRLASYAAHDAHAEGFAVAWGACTEELAVPYEPWIGVCSQLVESAPEELLARMSSATGASWPASRGTSHARVADLPGAAVLGPRDRALPAVQRGRRTAGGGGGGGAVVRGAR